MPLRMYVCMLLNGNMHGLAKNPCQQGKNVQDLNAICTPSNQDLQFYTCTCSKGFVYVEDLETCVLASDQCSDTSACSGLKSGSNCCQAWGDKTAVCSAATDGDPFQCTCSSSAYTFDPSRYAYGCQATDSAGRDYTKACPHTEFLNDPGSACLYISNPDITGIQSGASFSGLAPWSNTSITLTLQTYSAATSSFSFFVVAT
eukprot:SM002628S09765  [mRNA]  locus=s2628:15:1655:- [translate_table: standard]